MTEGLAATASSAVSQAEGAAKTTVSGLEHFFEVVFDLLVPVIAGIIGIIVGPMIFTGQCIADGISTIPNVGSTGITGSTVFAIGHLAGAAVIGTGAMAAWKFQEGKSGLSFWAARTGAGFAVGWTLGILFQLVVGEASGNTGSVGNSGVLDGWIDTLIGKLQAGASKLTVQVGNLGA